MRSTDPVALNLHIERLEAALRELVERWEECVPEIAAVSGFAAVHGWEHSGPTMVEPIERARALLPAAGEGQ